MRLAVLWSGGRASWCLLLLAAWAAAGSCRSLGFDQYFGGDLVMQVAVAQELNDLSPVAVELLVVYDKKLLATLEAMTAQQWFAQRDQLLQKYTQSGQLQNWKWEWVPGQDVGELKRDYDVGVRGGVLFANYFSPGDHRASVDVFNPFFVNLGPTSFTVERLN